MKYVYNFSEGNKDMRNLLGGKGANVAQMSSLGLNVPPGFIITTDACKLFLKHEYVLNTAIKRQVEAELVKIEKLTAKTWGPTGKTLLFSVRSGAPVSMPGMMDTILNLGLNDQIVEMFAKETNKPEFAYDCYRRLIEMYGNVVKQIPIEQFDLGLNNFLNNKELNDVNLCTVNQLKQIIVIFKQIYFKHTNEEFPQDINVQLFEAIKAVFKSWNNERAITYREINQIDHDLGTAVTIQSMVYGNYNQESATGVMFSRNPDTGENKLYGEYLINAQGEDIVAGIKTPENLDQLALKMPNVYQKLNETAKYLEDYYLDIQDIEFTLEAGKLYILQTRSAQRTSKAKIHHLLDLLANQQITGTKLLNQITPVDLESYLFDQFDPDVLKVQELFAHGLAASNGAATGIICVSGEQVTATVAQGKKAILVRPETSPEDIKSMHLATAIVTAYGGMTSHAAVVARGMGKCCVCGTTGLIVDQEQQQITYHGKTLNSGEVISVDGSTGNIYAGEIAVVRAKLDQDFEAIMRIIDRHNQLAVYANVDDPVAASEALTFGAQGVGLVRSEHMFFAAERLIQMQGLIISDQPEDRQQFLDMMEKYQIDDYTGIFTVLGDKPISVRLLDPPLHEFLPTNQESIVNLAQKIQIDEAVVKAKIINLQEENPMLGHRGCRLGITNPEIYEMQISAICQAIKICQNKNIKNEIKVIIPLISTLSEYRYLKSKIMTIINKYQLTNIELGVMIETPRAALISEELAKEVDFFSYGTNDLTQLTYGFSRDDAPKFLPNYYEQQILKTDPFVTIDQEAVGTLIKLSTDLGKKVNQQLKTGICGEHGGDYQSVKFATSLGLDYVSCSPKRIPVAKLAGAQTINE